MLSKNVNCEDVDYLLGSLESGSFDMGSMTLSLRSLLGKRLDGEEFNEDGDIWPFEVGDLTDDPWRTHRYILNWNDTLTYGDIYESLAKSISSLCKDLIFIRNHKKADLKVVGLRIEEKATNLDIICFYRLLSSE